MASTKRDDVNWKDKKAVWAKIPAAKSAVTRACNAVTNLTAGSFTYATPAACDNARKRLEDAFDFLVELHDRWTDLETADGNEKACDKANESLDQYEDNTLKALTKLNTYISANAPATIPAPPPRCPPRRAQE